MKEGLFDEVNQIFKEYVSYLNYLNQIDVFSLSDDTFIARSIATRYVSRVYRSFMRLSNKEKKIINKAFIEGGYERRKKAYKKNPLLIQSVEHFMEEYYEDK